MKRFLVLFLILLIFIISPQFNYAQEQKKSIQKVNTKMLKCESTLYLVAHKDAPLYTQAKANELNEMPKKNIRFYILDYDNKAIMNSDNEKISTFILDKNNIVAKYIFNDKKILLVINKITGEFYLYKKAPKDLDIEEEGLCKPYQGKPLF